MNKTFEELNAEELDKVNGAEFVDLENANYVAYCYGKALSEHYDIDTCYRMMNKAEALRDEWIDDDKKHTSNEYAQALVEMPIE